MKDPIPRGNEASIEYRALLDEITSRELESRTIETYADDALDDLVALVQRIVETEGNSDARLNGIEKEKRALENAGLDPLMVETTLDHIASVADSTKRLDALVMKKTRLIDSVLVPPDSSQATEITPGDGSFEKPKEMIPKLKTLLLLLEKGLDIDISDDKEVAITVGPLRPNMMRGASYHLVEIPSLERGVLVCDEVGNTTFVVDTVACQEYGISLDDLSELSKLEIDDLLEYEARLGRRINYSKRYVDNLAQALTGELVDEDTTEKPSPQRVDILKPKVETAPEGYLSLKGMAKAYGIAPKTFQNAIDALGPELGEVRKYRFGSVTTQGYSPEQIAQILDYLDLAEPAPEGYLSLNGMIKAYGIRDTTLHRAIDALGTKLGEVHKYRFGSLTAPGYSPDQIVQILDYLDLAEVVPEGYMSLWGIRKAYGIGEKNLEKAIDALGTKLGEVHKYRFRGTTAPGYSPEQQHQILEWCHKNSHAKLGASALALLEHELE